MRLGSYRTYGSFPVMLSAPQTLVDVEASGPNNTYFTETTEEDVFTSWWTLITLPSLVQSTLASVNLFGLPYSKATMLMVAYDKSGSAFYGLYGSTENLPTGNLNPFPYPVQGIPGVQGMLDVCTQFQCWYVRSDIPWWGNSGSLATY